MNAFRTITTLIAVSALTAACGDSPTGMNVARSELPLAEASLANGQSARRVALIAHFGDPVLIEAPARTTVGTPTDVYVTTYEGGCNREDVVASEVIGMRALVVPYRLVPTDPNVVCTAELLITRRLVRLTFASTGSATIRVIGREEPGSRLFAVERRIVVE